MKKKLGEDFLDYTILGACNPTFALDALKTDLDIGLLLPCNVIVYKDTADGVTVTAADPVVMLNISGSEELGALAWQVKERLQQAVESL